MTAKEADRLHVMRLVKEKRLTLTEASQQIRLSLRQTMRLWSSFKKEGMKGLISRKRGLVALNKISNETKEKIGQILRNKYADFGPTFAAEKLNENEKISVSKEWLRQLMIAEGIWIPKKKRNIKIFPRRTRRSQFGELIQIDGSYEYWFENRAEKCCLLVFVDDATSKIVEMRFCQHETTSDYFISLERYIKRYGKPSTIYSDKHSVFRVNREENVKGKRITRFGKALLDLGIELICANTPQAKGRVERKNGTLQDRLIKEMRLAGISSIEEGNIFLLEYMDKHNKQFGKDPLNPKDAHKPLGVAENLRKIFSIQETRRLSKDLSFQYEGIIYQIKTDRPSYAMKHANVAITDDGSGKIEIEYKGKKLLYAKWKDIPCAQGRIVDYKALNWISRKTIRPKKYHPWR